GWRACDTACLAHLFAPRNLGQAEVKDLGITPATYLDVGTLDISMNHPFSVRFLQAFHDLKRQPDDLTRSERAFSKLFFHRLAVHVRHHNECLSVSIFNLVDSAYGGMIKRSGCPGFGCNLVPGRLALD